MALCSLHLVTPAEQRTPRRVVDLLDPWIKEELEKPDRPGLGKWTPPRLFTVGRLDVQTQGLIFVTNNGEACALSFFLFFISQDWWVGTCAPASCSGRLHTGVSGDHCCMWSSSGGQLHVEQLRQAVCCSVSAAK